MAPKKKCVNGFSLFMSETQQELAKKGIKMSMSDMPNYCKKDWEKMSDQMKEMYKARGKKMQKEINVTKYTSIGEKVDDIRQQSKDIKSETDAMYLYIEELVRVDPASHYLPKQKYILIHVNPYACENEGFYFPAEISMAEFSLEKGLIRTFHQLVGFDKVRTNAPPAPTADINSHAENNHLITSYSKFPTTYKDIYIKIVGFIIGKDVDEAVLHDPTLDLPPIYTAHCSTGNELMVTRSSLNQLYLSACKDGYTEDLVSVFHLDKLFMEIKNVSFNIKNPSATEKEAIPSVALATENLSKDNFSIIKSIGCRFHDKVERSHLCSNYYVCKWIYILSTHCCQYFNIKLISGCHYDFDLIETEEIPFEEMVENLNVSKNYNFLYNNLGEKMQDLTTASFPALEGGLSLNVRQQPVWNRPLNKTDHKVNAPQKTIPNKDDNFPPLGGLQNVVTEKTLGTKGNGWQKNTSYGKGNTEQLNTNVKKMAKGRGYDGK